MFLPVSGHNKLTINLRVVIHIIIFLITQEQKGRQLSCDGGLEIYGVTVPSSG